MSVALGAAVVQSTELGPTLRPWLTPGLPQTGVRRLVHAAGLRYRVSAKPEVGLRRTADLLFLLTRVAVFIDGCFWHGCPEHYTRPKANDDYWSSKVLRNRDRDAETTQILTERGWEVLRFWEHEDPAEVAELIVVTVRRRIALRPRASQERDGKP